MRLGSIVFLELYIINFINLNNNPYPGVAPAAYSSVLISTILKPFGIPKNLLVPKMISNDSTSDLILKFETSKRLFYISFASPLVPVSVMVLV